jgi:hypothetical protein
MSGNLKMAGWCQEESEEAQNYLKKKNYIGKEQYGHL